MVPPSTLTNNSGMPFSVTDILQPSDIDASTSYKRSIEMAHVLAAASSSSASSSVYSTQLSSTHPTSNSTFGSSSIHNNYYGSSSTGPFPSTNQYYDYTSSFPNSANSTSQYSPSSCWYGPAASKKIEVY